MAIAPVVPLSFLFGVAGAGAIAFAGGHPSAARLLNRFLRWQDRQRQRAALLDLDARLLRDVGLTRDQAEREGLRHD
ncbi:MAG: DUF1127 domain-containing protein [Gemmobacter sp.]